MCGGSASQKCFYGHAPPNNGERSSVYDDYFLKNFTLTAVMKDLGGSTLATVDDSSFWHSDAYSAISEQAPPSPSRYCEHDVAHTQCQHSNVSAVYVYVSCVCVIPPP